MQISKSTYELLTPIINAIDKSISIQSIVELIPASGGNTGTYQLNICNTKWATQGFIVTINGNDYYIIELSVNSYLKVTGLVLPVTDNFDLYLPKFYHGTLKVIEQELIQPVNDQQLSADKLPMIWLLEPIRERVSLNSQDSIYKTSPCELYFLIDANFEGWSQGDHYTQAIKPMRQLIDSFIDSANISGLIDDNVLSECEPTDLPRFGRYTGDSGAKTPIFAQYAMSGTKLEIEIPFIRNQKNCC